MFHKKFFGEVHTIDVESTWENVSNTMLVTRELIKEVRPGFTLLFGYDSSFQEEEVNHYLLPQENESFNDYKNRIQKIEKMGTTSFLIAGYKSGNRSVNYSHKSKLSSYHALILKRKETVFSSKSTLKIQSSLITLDDAVMFNFKMTDSYEKNVDEFVLSNIVTKGSYFLNVGLNGNFKSRSVDEESYTGNVNVQRGFLVVSGIKNFLKQNSVQYKYGKLELLL